MATPQERWASTEARFETVPMNEWSSMDLLMFLLSDRQLLVLGESCPLDTLQVNDWVAMKVTPRLLNCVAPFRSISKETISNIQRIVLKFLATLHKP